MNLPPSTTADDLLLFSLFDNLFLILFLYPNDDVYVYEPVKELVFWFVD